MLNFFKAFSVFTGTVIGVGIFGLPYVTSKVGFFVIVFYFLFMSAVAIAIHLLYGKIVLGTKTLHRLPGYAEEYLGSRWKKVAFVALGLGLTGALLAYLIVGGEFLSLFLAPYVGGNALIYTLLFFSLGAFLIFRGIKSISQIELTLLVVFFVILIVFFIKAFSFINVDYLQTVDWRFFTLPYGIILFSLWGLNMVPEAKEILGGNEKMLKRVIISGILLATVTYLFFIFIIFGACGPNTSEEAILGLSFVLGDGVIKLGFIFGIITCFTSFITLGLTLKKIFWYYLGFSKNFSWFIACFLPLSLFLAGFKAFIDIISFTGALTVGAMGVIVILIYRGFLKKNFSQKMNPLLYLLPIFFLLGILSEVFYFVFAK